MGYGVMAGSESGESGTTLKAHDYIGLSELVSSASSASAEVAAAASSSAARPALDLNESATALRLGPPAGAMAAPPRNSAILEEFRKAQAMKAAATATPTPTPTPVVVKAHPRPAYPAPFHVFPGVKSFGVKRGFSETVAVHLSAREPPCDVDPPDVKAQPWMSNHHNPYNMQHKPLAQDGSRKHGSSDAMASSASLDQPSQGQAVGWPPVRSFVRNNAPVKPAPAPPASTTGAAASVHEKDLAASSTTSKSLFVKIYMDGVPFGRKVDLKTNNRYEKLYSALEEMFQQFISGHYSQTSSSSKSLFVSSSSRKLNFLDGSEYVLIYEDQEGDFMLVGDVPWELFVNTVKRLRIMKGSEEVNLAPKNADPVKTQPAVG